MKQKIRLVLVSAILTQASAQASNVFLDIEQVTPGNADHGAYTGTLNGVTVSGQLSGPGNHSVIIGVDPVVYGSTIDGSSPKFSNTVFSPSQSLADRVGYGTGQDDGFYFIGPDAGASSSLVVWQQFTDFGGSV